MKKTRKSVQQLKDFTEFIKKIEKFIFRSKEDIHYILEKERCYKENKLANSIEKANIIEKILDDMGIVVSTNQIDAHISRKMMLKGLEIK